MKTMRDAATQESARTDGDPPRLVVAIPTYRRADRLAQLLPLVAVHLDAMQTAGTVSRPQILVVDNDPAGSGRAALDEQPAHYPVRYVIESTPGIPAVRNRAIAEAADFDLLSFIDDDEIPRAGWLEALVATWVASKRPTAVMGRVVSVLDDDVDPWVMASGAFNRPQMPTGSEIDVAATGNLLLDLDQVRSSGVRFDRRIGLGGGSDTLFSMSLKRAGARLVWCNESVTEDTVEPERQTRDWVRQRAYSHGNITILVQLHLAESRTQRARIRLRGVVGGVARYSLGSVRSGWGLLTGSTHHRARGRRFVQRGAGMIAASAGQAYFAYARTQSLDEA